MRRASFFARFKPSRPSPAMVVALTALVVACAGTATAATVLIHSSSQIGNGVITGNNIHPNTITGNRIANGTIGASKLANGSIGTSKLTANALRTLTSPHSGSSSSSAVGSASSGIASPGPTTYPLTNRRSE